MALRKLLCSILLCMAAAGAASAETASFDLSGPALKVTVTQAGATLPIWQVPNLEPGDVLQVRPDFPPGEAAHYLLVVGFLRGATNPPPKSWFYKAETWRKSGQAGIKATVPQGAEQVLVFLAPATGGDFGTLVSAVRGRPGAFVRAAQALHQASLDRSRLDAYLAEIRRPAPGEPDRLKTISPLLTRSLTIKLNEDCLKKTPELQAACLTQGADSLVLDDGHAPSMVQNLTTGDPASLAMQMSATPKTGFGYYSPYVAAVIDIAHVLDGLHTAQYQYIPALPSAHADGLSLLLNTPPSFHKPQSVLVTTLPPVRPPRAPALEPVDAKAAYCLDKPGLVLPVDGSPLAFSTGYPRNLVLRVKDRSGHPVELPLHPDAEKGGLVADTAGVSDRDFAPAVEGVVAGDWGFAPFVGPSFRLETASHGDWKLASGQGDGFTVGRKDSAVLEGPASCVESLELKGEDGVPTKVEWSASAGGLTASLPLADAGPGAMTLLVKTFGAAEPQEIPIRTFAEAGRLDGLELHAGDATGVLKGARLDEVKALQIGAVKFAPGALTSKDGHDELAVAAADPTVAARLAAGQSETATAILQDGRRLHVKFKVAAARPQVTLIGKSVQAQKLSAPVAIALAGPDELPQNATLVFSVRAEAPTRFSAHSAIEVATADGSASTTLTPGAGLTLEDPGIGVASLDVAKAFGPSAFGGLKFRLVDASGASDWAPLATVVRVPAVHGVRCAPDASDGCVLSGSALFLIDEISSTPAFDKPVRVPEGFPGQAISVPQPSEGRLYVKLHDDPQVVHELRLPRPHAPAAGKADAPKASA